MPDPAIGPPFNFSLRDIATHIRYHADISTRPGQYDSLNKLADELMRVAERLRDAE
jgi:hypothetical protein